MSSISQAFRCFDEVARRGSVRKAAETLHLTAAAVNQQVLNFEAQVGIPLFDRLPRGMRLNLAGEIMLAAVRRSQRDFDNALSQVEDLRALRRGHVNVGVSNATAEYVLPQVILALQRSHPGITFGVRTGNGESLLHWVAQGEIDIACCLRRTPPQGVEEIRSFSQQLGVVTAPGHPLSTPARLLRLRDCLSYPLAMVSPDMELRSLLDRIDPRLARLGRPRVETTSVAMVRRLVAGSDAVAFLVPDNVAEDVAQGTLVWNGLEDAGARLQGGIYQRSGYSAPSAVGLFLAALEAEIESIHARFEAPVALQLGAFAT